MIDLELATMQAITGRKVVCDRCNETIPAGATFWMVREGEGADGYLPPEYRCCSVPCRDSLTDQLWNDGARYALLAGRVPR
jgi:hypothetical protein